MLQNNPTNKSLKSPSSTKYTIITSSFNTQYTGSLKNACQAELLEMGVAENNIELVDTPGALEIPITAKLTAMHKNPDVMIALGVIFKGETYHFENTADECARGCQEVAQTHSIPIIYEVLACYNEEQAAARCGQDRKNKGIEAAQAAVRMAQIIEEFKTNV